MAPGSGMYLVDGQRLIPALAFPALAQPLLVPPVECQGRRHHGARGRRMFGHQCQGVGLQGQQPIGSQNLVFVDLAGSQPGNEDLPDTGPRVQPHGMAASIPAVEVAHHGDPAGIRRPDHEAHAAHAIHLPGLCAETASQLTVASMLYRDYSRKSGEWIPNRHGGRENLEAIEFLRHLNDVVAEEVPGALVIAEESTAWPGVSHPTREGGLGFSGKWNKIGRASW